MENGFRRVENSLHNNQQNYFPPQQPWQNAQNIGNGFFYHNYTTNNNNGIKSRPNREFINSSRYRI